jgi:CcmD family protein
MRNYAFLFWGYTTVWVGIVAYLVFLGLRLRATRRRIERLERDGRGGQNAAL